MKVEVEVQISKIESNINGKCPRSWEFTFESAGDIPITATISLQEGVDDAQIKHFISNDRRQYIISVDFLLPEYKG